MKSKKIVLMNLYVGQTENRHRDADIENRFVDSAGEGESGNET